MAADININIGVTGANEANNKLQNTEDALKGVGKGAEEASKGLGNLKNPLENTTKKLPPLANASNTAGQSLVNLGRIAQDAPFGFIGIQNNINPLLESFGRLKAETGSTGSAFKVLAGSLIGPAGLGLAVSVATGLLTTLVQQGFFKSEEKTKAADEAAKKYAETLNSVFNAVGREATNTLSLIAILQNENETRDRKVKVLKQLNDINPEVFKNLKIEEGNVIGLTAAYDQYINSLKKTAAAKVFQARLEKEVANLLKLQGEDKTIGEKQRRALLNFYSEAGTATDNFRAKIGEGILGPIAQQKAKIKDLTDSIKLISDALTVKDSTGKATKNVESYLDVLNKLKRELGLLKEEELTFNVSKTKEKISAIESAINTLSSKFKLDPKGSIIQQLFGDIKDLNQLLIKEQNIKIIADVLPKSNLTGFIEDFQAKIQKIKIKPIELPANITVSNIERLSKQILETNKQTAENLKSTYAGSFAAIGEAIGQSLATGGNVLQSAFETIIHLIGTGLKIIGEGMVKVATAKMVLEKLNFTPGAGTLIAGIVAIAAGSYLQNLKIPGFANGVNNFAGGMAIVGERGPELVRLPTGSDVIPNHRLNSLNAMDGRQVFIPSTIIRGSDIVISYNRQTATNRRNG